MKKLFLVWYDPEIKEVMNIEQGDATQALLNQLKKENIEVCEIYEENLKKANEVFLKNIEELKPNLNILPTYRENVESLNIEQTVESKDLSLDQTLDMIEQRKPVKASKLH